MEQLQAAAKNGLIAMVSKNSGEKRCAWARDKAGRTLLHTAVLYERPEVVRFLIDQFPHLINSRDNLNRTPLHLCVCLKNRHEIWPQLQEAGADPKLVDANNMSVYDYVREIDTPTPLKKKSRGRRWRDYKPTEVIEHERSVVYGQKANTYMLFERLMNAMSFSSPVVIENVDRLMQTYRPVDFSIDDLDILLMQKCLEMKLEDFAIYLLTSCGCRIDVEIPTLGGHDGSSPMTRITELANELGLDKLTAFLKSSVHDSDVSGVEQWIHQEEIWEEQEEDGRALTATQQPVRKPRVKGSQLLKRLDEEDAEPALEEIANCPSPDVVDILD
jgi:hypothetical protein